MKRISIIKNKQSDKLEKEVNLKLEELEKNNFIILDIKFTHNSEYIAYIIYSNKSELFDAFGDFSFGKPEVSPPPTSSDNFFKRPIKPKMNTITIT